VTRDGRKKKKQPGAAAPTPASPEAPHASRGKTFALIVALAAALVAMAAGLAAVRWARPKRPNLLLVTIDTLRADHVGVYGAAAAQTPTLDGLARRGVMFRNAQTAIPLTGPSHATVMTGLYPPAHGVRDNVVFDLPASRKTLATLLHGQGYRTAAFVGAYPVAAAFGFRQGFDVFDESFHQNPVPGEGAERPANEVADAAIRWIEAGDAEPFFLWTHFYDPHAPYAPPPPFRESFHDHPYDGEIAFADAQVGRVLETLRAAGKLEGTVVAILSDHGESLGEHGEATHAVLVYESTLHVPWIVAGPQVPAGKQIAERVATVDVLPTLLGLVGLPAPPELLGRDLRPALAGKRIPNDGLYAESLFGRLNCRWAALRSWTQGNWKLIDGGESELFDLAADPHESASLASKEPERMRQMQQALRAALQKMAPAGDSARPNPISAEQEERLRALGYTAGGGGAGASRPPNTSCASSSSSSPPARPVPAWAWPRR
jgi:arylsulfatase A-like enzyme